VIGNLFNRINDWDIAWVGFDAIRPARDQNMRAKVVLCLALLYCPLSAAIAIIIALLVLGRHASAPALWGMGLGAAAGYFLLQCLSAYFWNRRARRMREIKADSGKGV
jgi:hypothetical protein